MKPPPPPPPCRFSIIPFVLFLALVLKLKGSEAIAEQLQMHQGALVEGKGTHSNGDAAGQGQLHAVECGPVACPGFL